MSAGGWFFLIFVLVLLGGLVVWSVRGSHWPADRSEDEPDPGMGIPHIDAPKAVAGWEWRGLEAHDALSLIPPDKDGTYTVRINDDNTFSVRNDP